MPENRFFDKRCAQHYISTGVLNSEVFQQHLDALPDLFEKACPIEARLEGEEPTENAELLEGSELLASAAELNPTEEGGAAEASPETTLETP